MTDIHRAIDALLAFRHGNTKHLTKDHARILFEVLSAQQREPGVRVKELEWEADNKRGGIKADRYWIAAGVWTQGYFLAFDDNEKQNGFEDEDAAKSAAQADYEQRIMAGIEIAPQSDRQPLPGQKQISETGKELPENAEQPMNNADVSVGELAGFFVTEFPHLLTVSTQIEVARALLSRFRIERLDRLASGRR